jgi:hypothetical protein
MLSRFMILAVVTACRGATAPVAAPTAPLATAAPIAVPADDTAPVVIERVTLDDGRTARARYDFDADALRGLVALDGGVVAATASGNLVGFTSKLVADRLALAVPPVRSLASDGHGGAVAGLGDGTIAVVAPRTLALTRLGAVPGVPRWIGRWRDQLVIVVEAGRTRRVHRLDAGSGAAVGAVSADVGGSTWTIDDAGRLWSGLDAGEWGGSAMVLDLATGAAAPAVDLRDGVLGLVVHDGDVLAYGGSTSGAITSLVRHARIGAPPATAPEDGAEPIRLPVTRMIAQGDHLVAFLWNIAFAVDPTLTTWTRIGALPARVRWGRPDAVGAYPAIVDAVTLPDGAVVVATVRDGLFRLGDGAVTAHALAGPVGFAPTRVDVSGGAVVVADGDALWRRAQDRWEPLILPAAVDNVTELAFAPGDRAPGLVAADTWDGVRVIAWGEGAPTVIDSGPRPTDVAAVVGVGDELWRIGGGALWQWRPDGTWRDAGRYRERDDARPGPGEVAMPGALVGVRVGDHRLIVDGWHQRLLRLTLGRDGRATLADRGGADRVAKLDRDRALVILGGEVRTYAAATGALTPYPVALPPVIDVAVDAAGRLWFATTAGLLLVEGGVAHPVPVTAVGGRQILDLAVDPAGGVTLALGGDGLVRVTLE